MYNFYCFFVSYQILNYNIHFILLLVIISFIINNILSFYVKNTYKYLTFCIKLFNILSLGVSLLLQIIILIYFFFILQFKINNIFTLFNFQTSDIYLNLPLYSNHIMFNFMKFKVDFFALLMIFLAIIVGFFSLITLEQQFFSKNIKMVYICNLLVIIIYIFCLIDNYFIFFLMYELLLIPSFLFVYLTSTYKKGILAAQYFLIWTQIGSLFVLIAIIYIYTLTSNSNFSFLKNITLTRYEAWYLYFLIFLGFGFKVPVWPFHYWITKTHVEAPAGFSIFLSGFLVKTAVYGFYKLSSVMFFNVSTLFFSIFPIIGVIDSSFKMWGQIDLKKLVAYCTIQEMSLLYLVFVWGDSYCIAGGFLLCLTHSFLSPLMFFLVDCVQKRYKSRLITEVSGVINRTPNLGIMIIIMVVLYSGIPFSLKFLSEIYIFSGLLEAMPMTFFFLIFSANFIGLIGFSKIWFNLIFGYSNKLDKYLIIDLNSKELLVSSICIFFSFSLIFVSNINYF